MTPEIDARIKRLYAAMEGIALDDPRKIKIDVLKTDTSIKYSFDGEMTDPELENSVMIVINLIAHFPDHLKKWIKKSGRSSTLVDDFISDSIELKLVIDLSNRDKHGGFGRDGGLSKKNPVISNLYRALRLKPGNGYMSIEFPLSTGYPATVEGSPLLATDGDVLDSDGHKIYDLRQLLDNSLLQLENLLAQLRHAS